MDKGLKLFVWKDVLKDYTSGIAFAIAETEQEARELLLKQDEALSRDSVFNISKPEVYETEMAITLWGGG